MGARRHVRGAILLLAIVFLAAFWNAQPQVGAVPPVTLRYFDARGAAETSRLLLAIGKQEYQDSRYTFKFGTPGDFSTIQRPEFDAAKASGALDANLGKVPILDIKEGDQTVSVGQSKAIERYLARAFGLMGNGDVEAALVDATAEHVRDIRDAYGSSVRGKQGEERAVAQGKYFENQLPELLGKLEKSLALTSGADGCAVGSSLSLADVVIYQLFAEGFFMNGKSEQELRSAAADCPKVLASADAVAAHPEVQSWIAQRPENTF